MKAKYNIFSIAAFILAVVSIVGTVIGTITFRVGFHDESSLIMVGGTLLFTIAPVSCTAALILAVIALAKNPPKKSVAIISIIVSAFSLVALVSIYAYGAISVMSGLSEIYH